MVEIYTHVLSLFSKLASKYFENSMQDILLSKALKQKINRYKKMK